MKQAMLHDAGSWHFEFIEVVRRIREKLLEIAGLPLGSGFVSILMQGSGTFGVEAVMASVVPPDGRLLVLANGAYGERIVQIASHLKIAVTVVRSPENETPDLAPLRSALRDEPSITNGIVVHCETTTGILNPRAARYRTNHAILVEGIKRLGFQPYLDPDVQSYIITSFHFPKDSSFQFADFYRRLADKNMIIYPGKISQTDTFRIGSIGRIFEPDVLSLLWAVGETAGVIEAMQCMTTVKTFSVPW